VSSVAASLRIVARVDDPSSELFEYLSVKERVDSALECWVDLSTPRDFEWTDEIREKTVEYGIADDEGSILATFPTMADAEAARSKARVKIALAFADDDDERKVAPAAPSPVGTETDTQTGMTSIVGAAAGL
jgi:hypothetical protein